MSLLDRINSIHESLQTKAFKTKRDAFLKLENPTDQDIAAFEKFFKETEDKQKFHNKTESEIVRHWNVYQSIVNDPRLPKENKAINRSLERLRKGFATLEIVNDHVVSGKVNSGSLNAVTSETLKKLWDEFLASGGEKEKKAAPKRERAEKPRPKPVVAATAAELVDPFNQLIKDSQFILVIGAKPEVSKAVDDLKALIESDGDPVDANRLWAFLQENVPESTTCKGENCNAQNTKLQDGLCVSCLKEHVEGLAESITDRFGVYKEEYNQLIVERKKPQAEKDALKKGFNSLVELKEEHDERHHTFDESGGAKGYAKYMEIYKKLDALLPTESTKRSRRFNPDNDEIINSDESEASSDISHSGGDSEYQSDSSSSHSGAERRKRKGGAGSAGGGALLGDVLDYFSPIHPEIARLSDVYKKTPNDFSAEFEATKKKGCVPRYKVVPYLISTGAIIKVNFDEPIIFSTEEAAIKRGEEACAETKGTIGYKVIKE